MAMNMNNSRSTMRPVETMLPSNVPAEEGIIAHLLESPRMIRRVQDSLTREDFVAPHCAEIFDAALFVFRQGRTCTINNIVHELTRRGRYVDVSDGTDAITHWDLMELQGDLRTATPLEDYVRNLKETMMQRRLALFGMEIYQAACRRELDVLGQAQADLLRIAQGAHINSVSTMADVMHQYREVLEQRRYNLAHEIANGIPTGFPRIDRVTGGLQRADLIILAARPGFGKTAAALNIALWIASHARHVLFFTREMSKMALAQRLVAMDVPMDQSMLREGDISNDEMRAIDASMTRMSEADFQMDERARTISEICTAARSVHFERPLDLIVIDYLQLVEGPEAFRRTPNREAEVSEVSRQLKLLAIELDVPVLALAQLNRGVESRQNKVPQMSDLRESGAIEQNADIIGFLHVPEDQLELRQQALAYLIQFVIAKHRNGQVATLDLEYRPRSTKFVDPTALVLDVEE